MLIISGFLVNFISLTLCKYALAWAWFSQWLVAGLVITLTETDSVTVTLTVGISDLPIYHMFFKCHQSLNQPLYKL